MRNDFPHEDPFSSRPHSKHHEVIEGVAYEEGVDHITEADVSRETSAHTTQTTAVYDQTAHSQPPADRGKASARRHSRRNHWRVRSYLRRGGWMPMYHGAWAMITIPPLLAIAHSSWHPRALFLLAGWWIGYFAFYAMSLYAKSRWKARYLPATLTYSIASAAFLIAAWTQVPSLWVWLLPFALLATYALQAAYRREERSLTSGFDTVAAASLILPVMWHYLNPNEGAWLPLNIPSFIWFLTLVCFTYFAGTVLYVKTNIRELGSWLYYGASVAWHVLTFAVYLVVIVAALMNALFFSNVSLANQLHPLVFLVTYGIVVARAIAVPIVQVFRPITAAQIGLAECGIALILTLSLIP